MPDGGAAALGDLTWPEVADALGGPVAVVVPVGSCEQHGPHLPIATDTIVASALAAALATARPDAVLVAPALGITASGEHAGFPGTLSIGTSVLVDVLVEVGRSADWSAGVVFVNGHGGNSDAVGRAVARLRMEERRVMAWAPRVDDATVAAAGDAGRADLHAGWIETSLLLHLAPALVRLTEAEPGDVRPLRELAVALRRDGVLAVSPNGVLGDPAGASAEAGAALFAHLAADLVARFDEWTATPRETA